MANWFISKYHTPTLEFALSKMDKKSFDVLYTGSGPDELFYGMEKYPPSYFKKLEELPLLDALKKIDTDYNYIPYMSILNENGKNILNEVIEKKLIYIHQLVK